jgi:hypothetical protein
LTSKEDEQKPNSKKGVYLPSWLAKLIVLIIVLAVGFGIGWHYGVAHQTNKDNSDGLITNGNSTSFVRHQVLIGTVTSITSTKIVVKSDTNTTGTAIINKSTVITNTKQQTVKTSSITVTSRVVITAEVNSNGSLTAQRILILE